MTALVTVGSIFVGICALCISCPSKWMKWDEWQEHIRTHHIKNPLVGGKKRL